VHAYTDDLLALMDMTRRSYPFFRVLVGCERMAVQSREVMDAFTPLSTRVMNYCPGPFAIGVKSRLGQLQVAKKFSHQRIRIFSEEGIARRWVLGVGERNLEPALQAAPSIPLPNTVRLPHTGAPAALPVNHPDGNNRTPPAPLPSTPPARAANPPAAHP